MGGRITYCMDLLCHQQPVCFGINSQQMYFSYSQHTYVPLPLSRPSPPDTPTPQVDTYGTQQPIALLKLLLEKGGMYDRGKDLNWKTFKDISYMAAMGKVSRWHCVV